MNINQMNLVYATDSRGRTKLVAPEKQVVLRNVTLPRDRQGKNRKKKGGYWPCRVRAAHHVGA